MSDPIAMDEEEVEQIMRDVQEALEGADGILQFICNEKTVLIRNDSIISASFDYRTFDEDSDSHFLGA